MSRQAIGRYQNGGSPNCFGCHPLRHRAAPPSQFFYVASIFYVFLIYVGASGGGQLVTKHTYRRTGKGEDWKG